LTRAAGILFCAIVAGCSPSEECRSPKVICAGLVTSTAGLADFGENQAAWSALQASRRELTIQHAAFIESVDSRDYEKNAAFFAQNGYDVILTVGESQARETEQVAARYPAVVFVGIVQSRREELANLVTITFPNDQMGFAAGWLAAELTESGVVGAACETGELESMRLYCEGFSRGALSGRPGLQVLVRYRDSEDSARLFVDPNWGARASGALINQGADVVFAAGGETAQGALLRAAEAGVYAIGAENDQWLAAPRLRPSLVTSVFPSPEAAIQELLRQFRSEAILGRTFSGTFAVAPFRNVDPELSEGTIEGFAELLLRLSAGEIETGVGPPR